MDKLDYTKFDLKWYVLNETRYDHNNEFSNFPYTFHNTNIRPWNVFNNWPFKEEAINLAIDYLDGNFNLETLREDNTKQSYDYKTNTFGEPYVKEEVAQLKTDFEAFKYELMKLLQWQEWSRCEYEILVTEWPTKTNKDGETVVDKVDTYTQVLPNAEIFANYVLSIVKAVIDNECNDGC